MSMNDVYKFKPCDDICIVMKQSFIYSSIAFSHSNSSVHDVIIINCELCDSHECLICSYACINPYK